MAAKPDNVAESYGGRTYMKQDRIESLQQRDGRAYEFVESLCNHMRMVESVIQSGFIKFIENPANEKLEFPPL